MADRINFESQDKMVSHPEHYKGSNGVEAWTMIEAFTADLKGIEAVDTANILKYAIRWKKKNGLQDLEKIIQTATHLFNYELKLLSQEKTGEISG
jgi:hypothetical protein